MLNFYYSLKRLLVRCTLPCALTAVAIPACAQYFQFSQYEFTGQRINPATTGNTRYAAFDLDTRTQRTGGDFNIHSNYFALSTPLLQKSTGVPWSGLGISVVDDHSSGVFKRQEAALSYAVHLRVNKYQQLSFGAKILYSATRISLDGFNTGSQFVPDRGFDNGIANGETFQNARSHYSTFSTGVAWQETNKQGVVTSHWGVTLFDLNQPHYSFFGNGASSVPASIVLTGGFLAYHEDQFSLFPEALVTHSSGTNIINAGARWRYTAKAAINQVPDNIDLITRYVPGRSGIVGIQVHRENFSFGVSYDFPFLTTNVANTGALEIALSVRKLAETKTRRIARKKRELLLARKTQKVKPVNGKRVSKDSLLAAPPAVEVVKPDSAAKLKDPAKGTATAGKVAGEPLAVEKITLHFHFEYNSNDLDDETEAYLDKLSTILEKDPKLTATITGHTDNIGPEKFNQRLSLRRAEAIKNYLLLKGVKSARMTTVGKGMTEPISPNDTEANQARNRRVEIFLYKN